MNKGSVPFFLFHFPSKSTSSGAVRFWVSSGEVFVRELAVSFDLHRCYATKLDLTLRPTSGGGRQVVVGVDVTGSRKRNVAL